MQGSVGPCVPWAPRVGQAGSLGVLRCFWRICPRSVSFPCRAVPRLRPEGRWTGRTCLCPEG